MVVSVVSIKRELMARIDRGSKVQTEKVERYCSLVGMYRKIEKYVGNDVLITVKNGKQEYTKSNPGLAEMSKINTQLINLSKDLGLSAPPPGASATINTKTYESSDLL